jgi:hypothetical protein
MSASKVREDWVTMQAEVIREAIRNKQSQEAIGAMAARYQSLPSADRIIVDELLAQQVLAQDEPTRFDAIALIDLFNIRSARPALVRLAARLESDGSPGAPYERARVDRLLETWDGVKI